MSTRDAGSIADAPGQEDYTPEQLAAMSPAELDALGAGYDHVRVLHVDPPPAPGSPVERRATRQVRLLFTLAGFFAFAFVFTVFSKLRPRFTHASGAFPATQLCPYIRNALRHC